MRDERGRYYPKDPKHAEVMSRGFTVESSDETRGPILFVGGVEHGKIISIDPWTPRTSRMRDGEKWQKFSHYMLKAMMSAKGTVWFEYWDERSSLPLEYDQRTVPELELIK